jgi:hypothetical protein
MATAIKIEGYMISYAAKSTAVHTISLFNSSKGVAILFFRPDGTPLPNNEIVDGIIHLFYYVKDFYNVFDLILRVKPLNVVFNAPSTGAFSGLNTPQFIPV